MQQLKRLRLIMAVCLMVSIFTSSFSQVVDSKQYNYVGNWYNWQGGRFTTNLNIPKSAATTGRDTGAIYYRLTDSSILVWTGSQWRAITGLPSQTGNNGKYLTTNGSVASWGTPANFANTNLTFTGNRTHNAAGNDLTFTNLAYWDNFSTERFYFEGSDGTSTGSINTGKYYVGLSRTTTGGKNSYIAINQNGNNEFQIGAYRTGANSNTYFLPDSIQTNKPIQYAANYGSLFNQRSLVDKRYVDSIITVGNSLTLQQVIDNGNNTTTDFNLKEGSKTLIAFYNDGASNGSIDVAGLSNQYISLLGQDSGMIYFTRGSNAGTFKPLNLTASRDWRLPNKSGTLPLSVRLNGTTYTSNDTGSIELGTISTDTTSLSNRINNNYTSISVLPDSAGFIMQKPNGTKDTVTIDFAGNINLIVDTTRIVTTDKTQTITGLKTFNAALGIGGSANASAAFDVTSTTQGTRPFPTMTTAQRNAISSPATGLLIFNSTDSVQQYYNGATWVDLSDYRLSRRISNKIEIGEDFFNSSGIFTGSSTGSNATAGVFGASGTSTLIKPVYRVGAGAAASNAMAATFTNSSSGTFQPRLLTNPYIFETRILADTCSATDTVVYRIGLELANGGSTATSYASHFAGFIYDPRNTLGQGASRFIQCLTRNNSNSVQVTSYVLKPNVWTKLKMVVSSTYCLFYIDDVLVYTSTSNLPTSTGGGYYFNYRAAKTVASGSNTFGMYIDYFSMEHYLDTKR